MALYRTIPVLYGSLVCRALQGDSPPLDSLDEQYGAATDVFDIVSHKALPHRSSTANVSDPLKSINRIGR